MRPALFCMPRLPVMKQTQEELLKPRNIEAIAYLDGISIGMIEVKTDTVEVVPFLQR